MALGEAPPPPLGLCCPGAGEVTDGLFIVDGAPDRVPNQFHCVKPKNSRISTSRARIAAAMPAPAPAPVSPDVSTTSEPAGLQYRRTLYPPAPRSTASTRMINRTNSRVPKREPPLRSTTTLASFSSRRLGRSSWERPTPGRLPLAELGPS